MEKLYVLAKQYIFQLKLLLDSNMTMVMGITKNGTPLTISKCASTFSVHISGKINILI